MAQGPIELLRAGRHGGASLKVLLQGPQEALARLLREVPGVESVACTGPNPNLEDSCYFTLETESHGQVAARVAQAVVAAGHGLMELTPVSASLEEVFMQLTTEEQGSGEEAA